MSLIKKILGERKKFNERAGDVSVTVNVSGSGAEKFADFMKKVASCCNEGGSSEIVMVSPYSLEEQKIKWAFDKGTKMSVNDGHLTEDLAISPARIQALVDEYRSGKRVLVLTQTAANLLQSREELKKYFGASHAAFKLTSNALLSAQYESGQDNQGPAVV